MEENNNTTTKKVIWPIYLILAIILASGVFYLSSSNRNQVRDTKQNFQLENTSVEIVENTNADSNSPVIKIEGGMAYFEPNEIRVKLGETVKIEFSNVEGMHDFILDEFNIKTKILGAGKTESIEFTADKLGEFEFYCSVANHRLLGMVGKLIVEE